MHPDKKVGLALGILLIGIVGAFFFRNEAPNPESAVPVLAHGDELDKRIGVQRHAPYLPTSDKQKADANKIPDAFMADVAPRVPSGSNGPVPEPIRPNAPRELDKVAPLPNPSSDAAGLDRALAGNPTANKPDSTKGPSTGNATSHEVVAGDTLSSISFKYFGTHRRFQELYEFNKDVLRTPNDLRLGMKLKIPPADNSAAATPVTPTVPKSAMATPETGATSVTEKPTAATPAATVDEPPVKPSFVRPKTSPVRPPTRSNKSLTQAPPPGVPSVEGLDPRRDPAVIASRPKPEDEGTADPQHKTSSN